MSVHSNTCRLENDRYHILQTKIFLQYAVAKRRPEKKSGLLGFEPSTIPVKTSAQTNTANKPTVVVIKLVRNIPWKEDRKFHIYYILRPSCIYVACVNSLRIHIQENYFTSHPSHIKWVKIIRKKFETTRRYMYFTSEFFAVIAVETSFDRIYVP